MSTQRPLTATRLQSFYPNLLFTERKSQMANGHIAQMGKGVLFQNDDKKNERAPDWKGTLLLSQDYKAGQTLNIGGWTKNTPKGQLISLSEDTYKPNPDSNYPKEVNRVKDSDVPF